MPPFGLDSCFVEARFNPFFLREILFAMEENRGIVSADVQPETSGGSDVQPETSRDGQTNLNPQGK